MLLLSAKEIVKRNQRVGIRVRSSFRRMRDSILGSRGGGGEASGSRGMCWSVILVVVLI